MQHIYSVAEYKQ